jgi:hypothetical protein
VQKNFDGDARIVIIVAVLLWLFAGAIGWFYFRFVVAIEDRAWENEQEITVKKKEWMTNEKRALLFLILYGLATMLVAVVFSLTRAFVRMRTVIRNDDSKPR